MRFKKGLSTLTNFEKEWDNMKDLNDEELVSKWKFFALQYVNKSKLLMPLIQQVSNLEKEMKLLEAEIQKRGIKIAQENG